MKILLAVSGGIDSMCMAHMLTEDCRTDSYAVGHCNFHLRGEESDADAALVRQWCDERGIVFYQADFDTAAYARQRKVSIEMAARELRYEWFARICREHGLDAVAVAHNACDNAETLMLNLLRGTGSRGLRGMAASSPLPCGEDTSLLLLRPLLGMSRAQIEEYAAAHHLPYRNDSTNAETVYKRNRIRHEAFPVFESINPSFIRTLNEDMKRIAQVDDIAEDYFQQSAGSVMHSDGSISIPALLGLKHWKYVLFRLTEGCGIGQDVLEMLMRSLESGRPMGGKHFGPAVCTGDAIWLDGRIRKAGEALVSGPGEYCVNGSIIRVEVLERPEGMPLRQPRGVLVADAAMLTFPFRLRSWRDGDWMCPLGMDGRRKKLSDIFTDLKMPLHRKAEAVVIDIDGEDSGRVLGIAGLRIDDAVKVSGGTKTIMRLTNIN